MDNTTLSDFIQKYNGRYVNFDTVYGPQCMDLYRQYVQEVLEFPQSPGVAIAAQVWWNHDPAYWERIPYTPGSFPLPGSVMIWNWRYGGTGHIAVVKYGDPDRSICFTQNDPKGSPAILKEYGYRNVLGWLQPKKIVSDSAV